MGHMAARLGSACWRWPFRAVSCRRTPLRRVDPPSCSTARLGLRSRLRALRGTYPFTAEDTPMPKSGPRTRTDGTTFGASTASLVGHPRCGKTRKYVLFAIKSRRPTVHGRGLARYRLLRSDYRAEIKPGNPEPRGVDLRLPARGVWRALSGRIGSQPDRPQRGSVRRHSRSWSGSTTTTSYFSQEFVPDGATGLNRFWRAERVPTFRFKAWPAWARSARPIPKADLFGVGFARRTSDQ